MWTGRNRCLSADTWLASSEKQEILISHEFEKFLLVDVVEDFRHRIDTSATLTGCVIAIEYQEQIHHTSELLEIFSIINDSNVNNPHQVARSLHENHILCSSAFQIIQISVQ